MRQASNVDLHIYAGGAGEPIVLYYIVQLTPGSVHLDDASSIGLADYSAGRRENSLLRAPVPSPADPRFSVQLL